MAYEYTTVSRRPCGLPDEMMTHLGSGIVMAAGEGGGPAVEMVAAWGQTLELDVVARGLGVRGRRGWVVLGCHGCFSFVVSVEVREGH